MASAPIVSTDRLRNVAVVGHGGAGKSQLVDAICYLAGTTKRLGDPRQGTAVTSFTPEEVAHATTIGLHLAHAFWGEVKVNLLDTPGYLDFVGETLAGLRVADAALVVVNAVNGVEVGTERVWSYVQQRGLPAAFFVAHMDRPYADFDGAFAQIREVLTPKAIPVEIPIGSGESFQGLVNLFTEEAVRFEGEKLVPIPMPPELEAREHEHWQALIETIAATDDELLERYLEGREMTLDEALLALKNAMLRGELVPVFCGAPARTWGVRTLMDALVRLFPSPQERPPEVAEGRGGPVELRNLNTDPFAALVFKTTSEPHVGELTYFRLFGGPVRSGTEVLNAARGKSEKLAHLAIPLGRERLEVEELRAGDIGVVAKLRDTHTNDTLCAPSIPLQLSPIPFPEPDLAVGVEPVSRGDEERISAALHKLHEEDPTLRAEYDPELGQTLLRGCGELHLEVQVERLKRKFHVDVRLTEPRVPYRETIRKVAEAQGKYKKQTGGRGQYGDAHVRLKPLPRGSGYRFVDSIVGGVIPRQYIPSVDKGIQEAARRGILAGYPVVDFEAECFFGSYHEVDSSDIAFQIAGSLAFQNAAQKADPVLLEPILEVEVQTPEEFVGDVIGDLSSRRGRILGIEALGRTQRVRALVPQAEMTKYSSALRSLTQGRGSYTQRFHGYEEMPPAEAQKVIEQARRAKEEVAAR